MQNEGVARRYATAIFALAKERGKIEEVGRDLRAAADAIGGNDDLRRFFTSPVIDRDQKLKVVGDAFAGLEELALHSILLLIRKRREALLGPIVGEYEKLALAESGRELLEIKSAQRLPAVEVERIVARLSKLYHKAFEVRQTVDPALLGGVRIRIGHRLIDGTISGRLDEFARELYRQRELS